jgi:membrane dipeptidase
MKNNPTRRIARIHEEAFTIDAHFDLLSEVAHRRNRGEHQVIENRYLDGFQAGGVNLIVAPIYVENIFLPEMGLRKALSQISHLYAEIGESPGLFRLCRSMAEACAAVDDGEIGLMLAMEGADPIGNDLDLLTIFYELGVRCLGPVWSRRNYAADGAHFQPVREGKKGGLTAFGIDLIERAEALGIVIDVSHLNDEGFWDVLDVAAKPVVATHANCRAIGNSMRNLTDEQIRALAATGGVIGVNTIDAFVHDDPEKRTIATWIDHVDHLVALVGIDHIGIGLDLCDHVHNYHHTPKAFVTRDLIQDHGQLADITGGLIRRGYSDRDIIAILGGNFRHLFAEIIG